MLVAKGFPRRWEVGEKSLPVRTPTHARKAGHSTIPCSLIVPLCPVTTTDWADGRPEQGKSFLSYTPFF